MHGHSEISCVSSRQSGGKEQLRESDADPGVLAVYSSDRVIRFSRAVVITLRRAEPVAIPADNGLGLDEDQGRPVIRKNCVQPKTSWIWP